MGPKMLPIALAYAQRAYLVVPIIDKAPKHAVGRGWPDASRHLPEIDHLFRTRRHTGIGIACGEASGCWVLDEDGEEGATSLKKLIDKYGPLPTGPVTVTGKGLHHWFAWGDGCDQLRNRVGFAKGLDVRTNGGGVVVPPSKHPDTGRFYSWRDVSLLDVDPPPAPAWLITEIVGTYAPAPTLTADQPDIIVSDRYAEGALASAESRIAAAPNGAQRTTLYVESLSIGARIVGPRLCSRDVALSRLTAAGMRMVNHRPAKWTTTTVQRIVADGLDAGIGRVTNAA
jgi:hypothetical protein